jgi:hypothetical protein
MIMDDLDEKGFDEDLLSAQCCALTHGRGAAVPHY